MMTDAEKRELIAELRDYATALRASVHIHHTGADLIEKAADALEESMTGSETEGWEYNYFVTADIPGKGVFYAGGIAPQYAAADVRSRFYDRHPNDVFPEEYLVTQRRPVGPWEVVPDG